MKTKSYRIEVVRGYSAFDHLVPIGIEEKYATLKEARKALKSARMRLGENESKSRQVRCDIVRNDGRRFSWE